MASRLAVSEKRWLGAPKQSVEVRHGRPPRDRDGIGQLLVPLQRLKGQACTCSRAYVVGSRLPLADCLPVADGWTDDRAVMLPKKLQGFALGSVVERRPSASLPPLGFVSPFDASLRARNRRACKCHTRERSAGCKWDKVVNRGIDGPPPLLLRTWLVIR